MRDAAAIAQAVAALFDGEVGVGVTDPQGTSDPLWPGEDAHLGRSVPKRRLEFAAGRMAARQAMRALGLPPQAIPAAPDRAPIWPEGIHGSISHSDSLCVAVVTQHPRWLGVDIEPAMPLDATLLSEITGNRSTNPTRADLLAARRIFSAKEAAFKAQFPASGKVLGFGAVKVVLEGTAFTATFTDDVPPFTKGDKFLGRHGVVADHFVTAISIDMHPHARTHP